MADKEQGLTGIREDIRGFVGSRPGPVMDRTHSGRSRIKMILACGPNNEKAGKLTTWRYCVGYDKCVDNLSNVKIGDLVHASGWLITEYQVDEYYKPLYDEKDRKLKREVLVLYKAEIKQYEKRPETQPVLINA